MTDFFFSTKILIFFGWLGCETKCFLMRRRKNMKLYIWAGRRSTLFRLLAAGALWSAAAAASAHHSFAMFDPQHPVQIEGTVKSWEFTKQPSWSILSVW